MELKSFSLAFLCIFLMTDQRCLAIRKMKRFRPPPQAPDPKTPLGSIQGSDDSYFKYEIMQELPGGRVTVGSNEPNSRFGEFTTRTLEAKPFLIDKYPVSVGLFQRFLETKRKYVPNAIKEGYSFVFRNFVHKSLLKSKDILNMEHQYLVKVPQASWRMPEGPGASRLLETRLLEPVVHVNYQDASAYCSWKKKRLPTELEWEFAARGKLFQQKFPWGKDYVNNRSNLWDGVFPHKNLRLDGYEGLSPVNAYPAQNTFDMYDMLGNVWEWTMSLYREVGMSKQDKSKLKYVTKGTSFVDTISGTFNHAARVSARKPQHPNATLYNLGFRCALSKSTADSLGVYRIPQHNEL